MEPWFAWGKNPSPGEVNLYTYYLDMEPDPKMVGKYWGNGFFPARSGQGQSRGRIASHPPLNQWQCWEFMIQANTAPDKADGKQAMWWMKVDRRIHRHPLAQTTWIESELLLARTLRLRRG